MKYKLVVFDMDGTILDTLSDLKNSVNHALYKCGFPLRTLDEVRGFVGNGIPNLIERAVPLKTSREDCDKVYKVFTEHYKVHCKDETCPYNGIKEAISAIKESGMKTCVVSNKDDYAVKELSMLYFGDLFDYSLGRKDGVEKKPAPDMVNTALKYFKTDKREAVYVGDSDVDYMTAANSGLDFIGVSWGFKGYDFLKKLGAKTIVNTPRELLELLL